jgi:hypothetical protein
MNRTSGVRIARAENRRWHWNGFLLNRYLKVSTPRQYRKSLPTTSRPTVTQRIDDPTAGTGARERILRAMTNGSASPQDTARGGDNGLWWAGLAVLIVGGFLAFRVLNPIIAAAVVIVGATVLVMARVARNWDQHPGYEEREQARAEKRKIKFAQTQGARDKDRAKWEAHQVRQRQKAAQDAAEGRSASD